MSRCVALMKRSHAGDAIAGFDSAKYKGAFKAGEKWMTGASISWDEE